MRCNARKKHRLGKFPSGTKCRLKCRRGYRHNPKSGPLKTKCLWNGDWSPVGGCEAKMCDPLPFLENGIIDPPDCATNPQPGGKWQNNSFQKIRENTHNFYTVKKALYKYIHF